MRRFMLILALAGVAAVAGAIVFLLWDLDWRWRPHTVTRDQADLARALDQSGWVSPHLQGPKVYIVLYKGCEACDSLLRDAVPKLQAAEVDTRMIVVARPDRNGQALSTPEDRSYVAELWTNRSWKLFQQWFGQVPPNTPPALAKPPQVAAADGDAARTAVIEVGRQLVQTLTDDLKGDGVAFDYPTLVWWTKDGRMRACACVSPQSYRFVERELGA